MSSHDFTQLHNLVGYLAGTLATVAFVPQVFKILKERSTEDISLATYLLFCSGVGMWFIYGLMNGEWPIVIPNFITLILAGTILIVKAMND